VHEYAPDEGEEGTETVQTVEEATPSIVPLMMKVMLPESVVGSTGVAWYVFCSSSK
jgi:hypothetical protein